MVKDIYIPNLVNICVDERNFSGRFYHEYAAECEKFHSIMELLHQLELLYDNISFPQAAVELRNFSKQKHKCEGKSFQKVLNKEDVKQKRGRCATFFVYVQYRQNATWQGKIMWVEKEKEMGFRSVLEMIMLMDNALIDRN